LTTVDAVGDGARESTSHGIFIHTWRSLPSWKSLERMQVGEFYPPTHVYTPDFL